MQYEDLFELFTSMNEKIFVVLRNKDDSPPKIELETSLNKPSSPKSASSHSQSSKIIINNKITMDYLPLHNHNHQYSLHYYHLRLHFHLIY